MWVGLAQARSVASSVDDEKMTGTQQHTPASQHSLRTPGGAVYAGGHARAGPMSESSVSVVEEVYSPHMSESAPGGSVRSPSRSEAPSPVTSDVSSIEDEVRSTENLDTDLSLRAPG